MLPNTISDQALGRAFRVMEETQYEIAAWYFNDSGPTRHRNVVDTVMSCKANVSPRHYCPGCCECLPHNAGVACSDELFAR